MLQDIQYDSLLALMIIVLSPPENAPIWQRGESLTATTSRCTQASDKIGYYLHQAPGMLSNKSTNSLQTLNTLFRETTPGNNAPSTPTKKKTKPFW